MLKGTWLEPLAWWAYGAIAVTGVCVLAYAIVQQDYRESLNDPQIQLAEDAALRLQNGGAPADIVPPGSPLVDLRNSLAPWIAVYDAQGSALEASGQLDGAPPKLPDGVFDTSHWLAHPSGLFYNQSPVLQNRFTWQPESGMRQAVILTRAQNGMYIAAGRNMREAEQRIEHEGEIVFILWAFTLGCLLVASFIGWRLLRSG